MRVESNKAVCFTLWSSTHNNVRHADLFHMLDSVVRIYKLNLSHSRVLRGIQYRLWHAFSRKLIYPYVLRYLGQRYEKLLTVDYNQIPAWAKPASVIVDMDDPLFTSGEVALLNLPQVKAIVVTTERARELFQQLGVTRPIRVIPQGVAIEQIYSGKRRNVCTQFKGERDVVVGYQAPTLTLSSDGRRRARGGQDDLDFLFAVLEAARREEPRIKLWLIGQPSKSVKNYVADGRASWIKLFGYVPFTQILDYVSNFDIGVYARMLVQPPARFNVKLAQFMACGVPVVSRNLDESFILREARSGIVCDSDAEFSQALVKLARCAEKRAAIGNAGRAYAQTNLDWSILIPAYKEILKG